MNTEKPCPEKNPTPQEPLPEPELEEYERPPCVPILPPPNPDKSKSDASVGKK